MDTLLVCVLLFMVGSAGCFWIMMVKKMVKKMSPPRATPKRRPSPERTENKEVYVLMGSHPDSIYITPAGENTT